MNLPIKIALRYLFSKKSHSAINTISIISVCGVAVATMALICTLSVYNGFQELISSLYSTLDPQVKIEPLRGKTFDLHHPAIDSLALWEDIAVFSPIVEDNALIAYRGKQMAIRLKGVSDNYGELTQIDSILYDGVFQLRDSVVSYATLGVGVANEIGAGARYVYPLEVYAPKRKARVNMANPAMSFNKSRLFNTAVFGVNQAEYDNQLVIAPITVARELFDYTTEVTALELKLKEGVDTDKTIAKIERLLGDDYVVKNRLLQQETSYRMMQIEKWMTFLILAFILMIASFNVIGSLSMLIIDKQENIRTLRSLGADSRFVQQVFLFEGWFIAAIGAGGGLLLGVLLCLLQQAFGFIKLGHAAGSFVVDAYPVRVELFDVIAVAAVVTLLGFLTSWYPVRKTKLS